MTDARHAAPRAAFRWCSPPNDETVTVEVDGRTVALPASHSLLAGLLTLDDDRTPFFCAIGQCQRCVVKRNGERVAACLVTPRTGDVIEREFARRYPPAATFATPSSAAAGFAPLRAEESRDADESRHP